MAFLDKVLKTAEGVRKQLAPVEYDENNEYYHPEKKKYFSAAKI